MPIVTNGLSLHLDASNPSSYPGSGGVWSDLTNNNFDFTANVSPSFDNANGGSIYFDGNTNFTSGDLGQTFEGGEFTYEIWVNSDNIDGNILSERNGFGWSISLMDLVDGDVRVGFWTGGVAYISIGTIIPQTWNQIVLKYSGNTITGYLNGVLGFTANNFFKQYPNSQHLLIVGDTEYQSLGYTGAFNGKISDIRFYNIALSDAEVLQNYNATLEKFNPKKKSIRFQRSSKIQSIPATAYQYYKWWIFNSKYGESYVQMSEFNLFLNGNPIDMSGVTISLLNGHTSPPSEQAINLKDGSVYSKFLDFDFLTGGTNLVFDFGQPEIVNGYQWATANDVAGRDPRSWVLYGSNDNVNWVTLDEVNDYMATDSRWTYTEVFSFQNGLDGNTIPSSLTFTANKPDGLTPQTAGVSAYQIKTDYPASTDGLYWLRNDNINDGQPFQIYADMTTDGGGWTLLLTNAANAGWTIENAVSNNTNTPSLDSNYSIVNWGDYIKKSASGFQYMIEAETRGDWGGIWTANGNYSFIAPNSSQTDITLNIKFGSWDYNDAGIEERMPWYSANYYPTLTTNHNGYSDGNWWGTLVTLQPGWTTAPWIAAGMAYPTRIWYWVR